MDWSRVLLVGWGDDAGVTHYRTKLPARALGAEWVTLQMDGEPHSGEGHRVDHQVIVVQSCWEPWQLRAMQRMRGSGAVLVANVDDWLPSVAKLGEAHQFSGHFAGKRERTFVEMLRLCDAAICSTPFLVDKVRSAMGGGTRPVLLARNGLDLPRYDHWRGKGDRSWESVDVVIGWAGGTGHGDALMAILPELWQALRDNPTVGFRCIGDSLPLRVCPDDLKGRVRHLPWSDMMFYPVNLDGCDILLAPTSENDFYRGKSQLRFYEAAAMGKPVIANDQYDEVDHGRTGLLTPSGGTWAGLMQALIDNVELREVLGVNARDYAERALSIEHRAGEWRTAIQSIDQALVSS